MAKIIAPNWYAEVARINFKTMKKFIQVISIILTIGPLPAMVVAQNQDSLRNALSINSTISITNNGFSFIPAFTLDKPAGVTIITISKNRWSFQNQTRYALNGQPWAITFVTRYKVIDKPKATVTAGMYFPGISFFKTKVIESGTEKQVLQSQQAISPEFNASFPVSKRLMLGVTYLYNRSIGGVPPLNGHYGGIWAALFDLKVAGTVRLGIDTQLFYLNLDGLEGAYTSWNFIVSKKGFPITLSSMMFKTIKSNIGGKYANWNLSLNYVFGENYIKK